jgi:hypothetical protein
LCFVSSNSSKFLSLSSKQCRHPGEKLTKSGIAASAADKYAATASACVADANPDVDADDSVVDTAAKTAFDAERNDSNDATLAVVANDDSVVVVVVVVAATVADDADDDAIDEDAAAADENDDKGAAAADAAVDAGREGGPATVDESQVVALLFLLFGMLKICLKKSPPDLLRGRFLRSLLKCGVCLRYYKKDQLVSSCLFY